MHAFRTLSPLFSVLTFALASGAIPSRGQAADATPATVEALVYSTMPSTASHSPQMAMDSDPNTYFKSVYGMGDGDDLLVLLSAPIPLQSVRITTGDEDGQDLLTEGFVETSPDGVTYTRAASFDRAGIADATLNNRPVRAVRIRLDRRKGIPALLVREITINSTTRIAHVQRGPGRAFTITDLSRTPDLAIWAAKADRQMEAFWPDTEAMLYSDKFITPNKVNVVYTTGPGVTGVAATGGGVLTVNTKWCREHPEDTGLMVHEMAHVVQSMSAYNPVWLIEGIADYIRWVKFEPENHKPRINPATASYKDSYRTTATFLAWCELHYDSGLVTKLNRATRFATYSDDLFVKYCGKDVATLWSEFVKAYQADPATVITPTVAPADRPRALPVAAPGSSVSVSLTGLFDTAGIYRDGVRFAATGGFDAGGAAYSGTLLGKSVTYKDVTFTLGNPGAPNAVSGRGQGVALPAGSYGSLWLLGAAIEGNQMAQTLTVTYTDGTTETLHQNFSDWFQPQRFPGEARAVRMPYRVMADGTKDPRVFYAYAYGFPLNPAKSVRSVTLPGSAFVKVLAVTLAR
jgi:hypothetical protein